MTNEGIVNIHGKSYVTVAKRVELAHEAGAFEELETEVLAHSPNVVIKAKVTIKGKTYTGISAANSAKPIEKQSPYEVAETSAVGRALGFAGYGVVESIASADEMVKAEESQPEELTPEVVDETLEEEHHAAIDVCPVHQVKMNKRSGQYGVFYSHYKANEDGTRSYCSGKGWK